MADKKRRNQTLKPRWFQILLAVSDGPKHGSEIVRCVLDQTDGELRLWPAMLYGSLDQLTGRGLIEELDDQDRPQGASAKRRYFRITDAGHGELVEETRRLEGWIQMARAKNVITDRSHA